MGTYITETMGKDCKLNQPYKGLDFESNCGPAAADHSGTVLYNIKKDPIVGRYMVAARDILPGEVIFSDQPAVDLPMLDFCVSCLCEKCSEINVSKGPDNSSKPLCLGCFRRVTGTFLCRGCNWPMCRESCCLLPSHVPECSILKQRGAKISVPWFDRSCTYYDAILPLRVLLLRKNNPKVYRLITMLMDHNDDLDESTRRRRQTLVDFMRKSLKLGEDFSEAEIHRILGILSVNSFVVHDGSEDVNTDLIGLYPWTSIMSHNCIANTKITTREDFSYVCEATLSIKAGEEIVTNYHHYHYQLYGTSYRRADLKSTWSFDCLCPRCKDPTESGTFVSAVLCDLCKFGYALPNNSCDSNSNWTCDKCQSVFPSIEIEEKVKKFETEIDAVPSGQAEEFEKLLKKMKYALHENHYWILDVKRKLVEIYGNKPGFELYKLPKELLDKKLEYCEHLLSVAAKLCPGPSEMRGYLLWEAHGVKVRLAQWEWIRMKIGTPTYLERLRSSYEDLKEIISILGPIRIHSDEGQMGLKAKQELREVDKLIEDLSKQSLSTSTIQSATSSVNSTSTTSKPKSSVLPPLTFQARDFYNGENLRFTATISTQTLPTSNPLQNKKSICI